MKQHLLKSAAVSLEWRLIAFLITEVFFFATTGTFWQATILALELQLILLVAHFGWYFWHETRAPRPS